MVLRVLRVVLRGTTRRYEALRYTRRYEALLDTIRYYKVLRVNTLSYELYYELRISVVCFGALWDKFFGLKQKNPLIPYLPIF